MKTGCCSHGSSRSGNIRTCRQSAPRHADNHFPMRFETSAPPKCSTRSGGGTSWRWRIQSVWRMILGRKRAPEAASARTGQPSFFAKSKIASTRPCSPTGKRPITTTPRPSANLWKSKSDGQSKGNEFATLENSIFSSTAATPLSSKGSRIGTFKCTGPDWGPIAIATTSESTSERRDRAPSSCAQGKSTAYRTKPPKRPG